MNYRFLIQGEDRRYVDLKYDNIRTIDFIDAEKFIVFDVKDTRVIVFAPMMTSHDRIISQCFLPYITLRGAGIVWDPNRSGHLDLRFGSQTCQRTFGLDRPTSKDERNEILLRIDKKMREVFAKDPFFERERRAA